MEAVEIATDENDPSSFVVLNSNGGQIVKLNSNRLITVCNGTDELPLPDKENVLISLSNEETVNDQSSVITLDPSSIDIESTEGLSNGQDREFVLPEIVFEISNEEVENSESKSNMTPVLQKNSIDSEGCFKCNVEGCGKTITGLAKLKSHALSHSDFEEFKCIVGNCKWSFKSGYKLRRHLMTHAGHKEFLCDHEGCEGSFTTIYNLKAHKKIHERPVDIPCTACDKKFATKRLMQIHLKTHEGVEAAFKCPFENCKREFHMSNALTSHMKMHQRRKENELKCKFEGCNKVFETMCRLKEHARQHTGERPYVCLYQGCNWSFTTSSKRARHARKHTGERKHVCTYENCFKAYRRPEHLKEHLLTHTTSKSFHCSYEGCDAKFSAKSSLYVHIKKHLKPKPPVNVFTYICPINECRIGFKDKDSLKQHLSSHSCLSQTSASDSNIEVIVSKNGDEIFTFVDRSKKASSNSSINDNLDEISESNQSIILPHTSEENQAAIDSITENLSPEEQNSSIPELGHSSHLNTAAINQLTLPEKSLPIMSNQVAKSVRIDSDRVPYYMESTSTFRLEQENSSGSARTDYCCMRSAMKVPLKKHSSDVVLDSCEESSEEDMEKNTQNENSENLETTVNTPVPDLALAPTDVVLTSGAITFRDPITGAHFIQTQLLQDDPPCLINDAFGET